MSSIKNKTGSKPGQALWRSLDEYADSPEFRTLIEKEFPNHAPELFHSTSRRHFLKVMGASVALAGGLAGCRWPQQQILPHTSRPEGRAPGVPVSYASCWEQQEVAEGVLVTSYDGRPIRVDGNGDHPFQSGSATSQMQASVLGLYDPGRSSAPTHRDGDHRVSGSWEAAAEMLAEAGKSDKVAVLAAPKSSLALSMMRKRLLRKIPNSRWHEWAPLHRDSERQGTAQLFGRPMRPVADLSAARVLVCLDADPLMTHPASLAHSSGWASLRSSADDDEPVLSRVWAVESSLSVTGGAADVRIPARTADIAGIAVQLAAATGVSLPSDIAPIVSATQVTDEQILQMAADLKSHAGNCLVMAGDRQPPVVHALAHAINIGLGAVGKTLRFAEIENAERLAHIDDIALLADRIRAGEVETLLILGANPVYDAPAMNESWQQLIDRVPLSIHLGEYEDETAEVCDWHLNGTHFLEEWGDGRSWDGTITLRQPLIAPLYDGRSSIETLSILLDEKPQSGHDLVRSVLESRAGSDKDASWRSWLHDGFIRDSANAVDSAPAIRGGWGAAIESALQVPEGDEIVFLADHSLFDGRYANNGWLQELPDPVTKIAWDNCAQIAPSKAASMGIKTGDMIRLSSGGRELEMPAFVLPCQNPRTIGVSLGYGRLLSDRAAGRLSRKPSLYQIADGVGFDSYQLRSSEAVRAGYAPVSVARGSGTYQLATTQDHNPVRPEEFMGDLEFNEEQRRVGEFARVVGAGFTPDHQQVAESVEDAGPHHPDLKSLWKEHEYKSHRWAMSIDLNVCTGCSACVVACQAENNISVVGKDEVAYGREMHWMRIDRYFSGEDVDNPEVVHQPLTCNQCENAPCEQVCPVAATVHNEEGLNDMVYNRCIGTRYCSNNCPYKVRRFNYFNNTKSPSVTEKMGYNPEVTIRSRGVMEKCTYCVQRINSSKIRANNERRKLTDGEVLPACAQTCPTNAITFGDLADPESRVTATQKSHRSYKMLAELNVKPRTGYMAKLRNRPDQDEG
ncbi:MAG: TAT-variant-translocated molybdopterin oxidoreductase [Planctomycetota bacterium]|nr:TAT-variant-translocated molybdopterin oxidoreductase [Planctomycetota bacterium]